jgi:hypothetical protein
VLAWSCVLSTRVAPVTATLGGIGALLLLLMLWRGLDDLLGSALLLVGGSYVLGLYASHRALDEAAPLVAIALLACGELATWSLEARQPIRGEAGLTLVRLRAVAVLVAAGAAAAALVIVAGGTNLGGGLAWAVLGVASAVGVVAIAARLSRT